MDSGFFIHFTKWINILSISQNGQLGCPFHEMDNLLVHFTKWTISHLGRNIYVRSALTGMDLDNHNLVHHRCTFVLHSFCKYLKIYTFHDSKRFVISCKGLYFI